ncbi:MAG: hypothetical protein ACREPV_13825 [Lysobacter sp.]
MTTANRKAGRAGTMQAGEPFADGDNLLGLLDFATVAEGIKIGDHLRGRLAANGSAIETHAATADDAALAGDDAERQHADRASRLDREARRFRLAIERADGRLAEVAEADRLAEGEAAADRARALVAKIEAKLSEYVTAARRVDVLLGELTALQAELIRDRDTAHEAGVECNAQLPHEARFQPEIVEDREVVTRTRPPGVYNAAGHRLDGNGDGALIENRSIQRVVVQARYAPPDITRARAVLPNPDGGRLLDRGVD